MAVLSFTADNPEDTAHYARALSACLKHGEWASLCGIVGAGKTHFARAAVHYLEGADEIVPSPSFTLVQYYGAVLHADFYRLSDPQEIAELGVSDELATHIGFIEWADHANPDDLPPPAYIITLNFIEDSAEKRTLTIEASDARLEALRQQCARQKDIDEFLSAQDYGAYSRTLIAGDASGRSYQRIIYENNKHAILMDWQSGGDYNGGIDYVRKARLAEDTAAMTQIINMLAPHINVAAIYAADEAAGLLLCEDFGTETLATLPPAMRPPAYLEAIETLLILQDIAPPAYLPAYDGTICAHEAALFVQWYLPYRGINIDEKAARAWNTLWQTLGDKYAAQSSGKHIILRDYHSVNLHWQAQKSQIYRLGVIDVQDALTGMAAYDVVSLLQDARIDVCPRQAAFSLAHYMDKKFPTNEAQDKKENFLSEYAFCGAQRNFKIAGIFVRLAERDDKPHYLAHLPRIIAYLQQNLTHTDLAPIKQWLNTYAPDWTKL